MINLTVNGKSYSVDAAADTPLLWVLRDELGLTGTKYSCGMALCGACMVHVNGEATPSCITPVAAVTGARITTIEGLDSTVGKAVQAAWMELDVPQCGYCQSGQVMAATALLTKTPKPTDDDIDAVMSRNVCRCGTYNRVRAAIHQAAKTLGA